MTVPGRCEHGSVLVAILADTHLPRGARRLPDACVELIIGADLVIHAGDLTGASFLDELETMAPRLCAVHGNVDDPEVVNRLPPVATLEVAGAPVAVVHDAGPRRGRLERLRKRFPDADAVIFAHSHLPLHEREAGFQIFNPGSPTERRRAPTRTMGVATIDAGRIDFRHVELSHA
jgi:putative phosphoesterase